MSIATDASTRVSPRDPDTRYEALFCLDAIGVDRPRTPLDPPTADDWRRILAWAQFHGVLQQLAAAASSGRIDVPEPWRAILERQQQRNVMRAMFQHRESIRILSALHEADVPAVSFKGTTLSKLLYGSVTARISSDIDLLLPFARLSAARRVVEQMGYEVVDPASRLPDHLLAGGKDISYVNTTARVMVELHWRLFIPDCVPGFDTTFEGLKIEGEAISPEKTFLVLAHHALYHAWELLKWSVDIDSFVRNVPADWKEILALAEATGSRRAVQIALLVAHRHFDTPLPVAIDDPIPHRLARIYERTLLRGKGLGRLRDFSLQLIARERWLDRFRYLRMVIRLKPRDWVTGPSFPLFARITRLFGEAWRKDEAPLDDAQKVPELGP